MASRYNGVKKFINKEKLYRTFFEDRGVKQVQQYGTRNLTYPTRSQISELDIVAHRWNYGDHYYRLAHESYGDSTLWWVIAFFNQRPTETTLKFGDIIYVPFPLEKILTYYGV